MKKKKLIIGIISIIVLGVLIYIVRILIFAGVFKIIPSDKMAHIIQTLQISGAEDISIEQTKGLAFISSFDRKNDKGGIYLCEINNKYSITNLTKQTGKEFRPHGISLYTKKIGKIFLFVINHRNDKDVVEIFEYSNKKLIHRNTIFNSALKSLNDILAISENSFYVTADHGAVNRLCQSVSNYLMLKTGSVILCKNNECTKVANNISFANGINMGIDKKTVVVSSTLYGEIKVYNRNSTTDNLNFLYNIPLGTSPDNIDIDRSGHLIVAAHPKILKLSRYINGKTKYSPSQILQITVDSSNNYRIKNLFLDKGTLISASSVGVKYKNLLFIGSISDDKILVLDNAL